MSDFVEQCRREWRRLGVPDPLADGMATDLVSDLREAEAEGVSAEELLGTSAFDPPAFAASWAAERGIIPKPPSQPTPAETALPHGVHGRRSDRTHRCRGTAPNRRTQVDTPHRTTASPSLAATARRRRASPLHERIRPDRVDPLGSCDHRARLRRTAVVEPEPLAATHVPRVAITSSSCARSRLRRGSRQHRRGASELVNGEGGVLLLPLRTLFLESSDLE